MKRFIPVVMLCVIFILSCGVQPIFAMPIENVDFYYNGQIFSYELKQNVKTSTQFDLNYKINKYKRFETSQDRIDLLNKMLQAGIDKEIAINYLYPNLNKIINKVEKAINVKPKNATLKVNSSTEKVFHITKENYGICVDKQKIYSLICKNYLENKPLEIQVPTLKLTPAIFASSFEKFSHLRADFSTNISSSSADRKHNIKNAMFALNKVEIMLNQVFSFNKTVGRRTEQNGYRNAKVIVNNEFVDGVGGGVCQVSSTLYNSALIAGLEIVEANKHSKQVGYVKHGFDAMVNFGSSDFKFRNNTNQKITLITNIANNNVRIRIFGEDLNNIKYVLTNEIVKMEEPVEEIKVDVTGEYLDKVIYNDECFTLTSPTRGMHVKSYRNKYVDGNFVSSELLRFDKFKVQNSVIVYGAKPRKRKVSIEK